MKTPDQIDWNFLGFNYTQTPYNIRCYFRDGQWEKPTIHSEETIPMHMAASCLHYGQEAFEGLKAFNCEDGKIRLFRADKNAERLQSSARYLKMAVPPKDLFIEMCTKVISLNKDYVPPFETGGSLYLRPLLIGTGAMVGVKPSNEYLLIIFCTPVGSYFPNGMTGIKAIIDRKHDRAAPFGTGHVKAGGNYAASLQSGDAAKDLGYDSAIYLDPTTHQFIDECGAANFFGIKNNTYITPSSNSVLPSITNMSLREIARDLGLKVEERDIPVMELSTFQEAGACGTAAIITPIDTIDDPTNNFSVTFKWVGPVTQKLYDRYKAIQLGKVPDEKGWNIIVD